MDFLGVILRKPTAEDGTSVHQLITETPELDSNSCYCNLLQCSHFSDTSIIAEEGTETLGFISGYIKPQSPETLFVWQVSVSSKARGKGLGGLMLKNLLEREGNTSITHVETTITESNEASWALFNSLAGYFGAPIERTVMFDRIAHFNNEHDSELLARIGPLAR